MTTPCEVILFSKDKIKANKTAKAILHEAKRLEKKYNYFDPTSYLSILNRREKSTIDNETIQLLKKAINFYRKTEKVFDITVGTFKDIYKYSYTIKELQCKKDRFLPYVGCEHIKLKKDRLYFDNPYTKIDLGGFIKEYAVDRATHIIRKNKISSALVNFGGDLFALGKKPNGEKYKIGIKDPNDRTKFATFVEIENQALTTSASYERNITIENDIYSHIISPFTDNIPITKSISVISCTCLESGVYSTTLMIDNHIKLSSNIEVIINY